MESPSDIYTLGDIVVHNGRYFRALWWTQGNEPRSDVERDEWQDLGNVPAQDSPYFSDVSNEAWYAPAVNALASEGIVDGAANGINFQASRPITRAQFALWLCRALDIAPVEGGDNFSDAGNDAYTPYLAALKQAGIAKGDEASLFHPSDYITRQALCRLLYDACDGFAEDPLTTFAPYCGLRTTWPPWAVQPMSWCIERGLILEASGHGISCRRSLRVPGGGGPEHSTTCCTVQRQPSPYPEASPRGQLRFTLPRCFNIRHEANFTYFSLTNGGALLLI